MSKTKELFIIGATAASCAIAGYAFYKNNENDQDQQKEKMKQSLIASTSSAMDMSETDASGGKEGHDNVKGQDFKMTDDVGQDFGTRIIGPKTDSSGKRKEKGGTDGLGYPPRN